MRPKTRSAHSIDAVYTANHSAQDVQTSEIYTPSENFFTQPVQKIPEINADYWALMLAGEVDLPRVITYQELLTMPQHSLACTLACGGQQPGGDMIGHAHWLGVRLDHLLAQVSVKTTAAYARFYAADGYVTSLPLDQISGLLVAHQMNEAPLSPEHGFPARLIAPGLYGYKMPRWLRRIELSQQPLSGFWEKRGWPQSGEAQATISVTSPGRQNLTEAVKISGIAYGGKHVLTGIEVSIDDGPWMSVPFQQPASFSWAPWSINWFASAPGAYQVTARAVNMLGQTSSHTTVIHIQ